MTDNPKPHLRAALYSSLVAAAFLVYLFIFPPMQVHSLCEKLLPYAEAGTQAVIDGDWENARELTVLMYELYLPYDKPLRLYLNHVDVDQLRTRLLSCRNLARAEDDQIIVDLEDTKSRLNYLKSIETFSLWNIF